MVPNEKRMGVIVDGGRKLSYRSKRQGRWERKMGVTLDPTSVGRPSTPAGGPGDPPGGKKPLSRRGGPSAGLCLGSPRLACMKGRSGQV